MYTHRAKLDNDRAYEGDFRDKLIPFPMASRDPLWPVLARHPRNPFARFVRSVFFYPEVGATAASPNHGGTAYFPGKPLAH
jgi:hypothetical protein